MAGSKIITFYRMLGRKKYMSDEELLGDSGLKRALSLIDLIAMGVGSTLGVGIYVLAGAVAKQTAGPAVVISFLIAAVASTFAGICYAEFAARVPKAGSAYVYSYVCVGEFVAFIIGWNLILEYVVGAASVVRALSGYIDNLFDNVMAQEFRRIIPIDIDFLSPYPDFFAFSLSIVFSVIVAIGVQESSTFHTVFTAVNITVVLYTIICGLFKVDVANWNIPKENIPSEFADSAGEGGFTPFGINGIISGAASCFYGFVGFDSVATTGEEAKNPQRNIPIAIILSLLIIFLAYLGISIVLTMMWPYYDQNADAPLPHVFREIGWDVAAWIVTIGALFALCATLMGAIFPLPRVMYAMAQDGVIFHFLGMVSKRFQTPTLGTMIAGLLIGLLSALFNLQQLVDMMSIGTLLAYSIVAACVMLLRYQPGDVHEEREAVRISDRNISVWSQLINFNRTKSPSFLSANISSWGVLIYTICATGLAAVVTFASEDIGKVEVYAIVLLVVSGISTLITLIVIGFQPASSKKLFFKVPLVPLIPGLSILMNIYLMLSLDGPTWIRYAVWMLAGFLIYFCYGIWKSVEEIKPNNKQARSIKTINGLNNDAFEDEAWEASIKL